MKRTMTAVLVLAVLAVLGFGGAAMADGKLHPLGSVEMAAKGATHVIEVEYRDLTTSATNTAQVFTNGLTAKTGVEFVGMHLDAAFDTGNTNFTGSVALTIGDASDADYYLTSTELASDGTEVWFKWPRANVDTAALTLAKQTFTNLTAVTQTSQEVFDYFSNSVPVVVTNVAQTSAGYTVVTNVTLANTASTFGATYYATATNLLVTLTPNVNEALDDNTSGKVRLYFRLMEFGR